MEWFDEHFYDENVYNSMSDGLEAFVEFIEEQKTYDDEEILLVSKIRKKIVNSFDPIKLFIHQSYLEKILKF